MLTLTLTINLTLTLTLTLNLTLTLTLTINLPLTLTLTLNLNLTLTLTGNSTHRNKSTLPLAQWNNCPRIDMSTHSDILSWFWATQYLLFLLNAACFAEKQQIPMLQSLVWPDRGSLTITSPMSFKQHVSVCC